MCAGVQRAWRGLAPLLAVEPARLRSGAAQRRLGNGVAVGDALGSCVFNLAMLVVLDALHRDAHAGGWPELAAMPDALEPAFVRHSLALTLLELTGNGAVLSAQATALLGVD